MTSNKNVPGDDRVPEDDSHLDETVEETHAFDPDQTIEESRPSELDATIEEVALPDPHATVDETREFDLDATIDTGTVADTGTVLTRGNLSSQKTRRLDETAEAIALETVGGTFPDASGDDGPDRDGVTSVLDDTNLGQTINPRALSEAEAKYWNEISSEFTSNREPTALPPAVDRTIVETRLQLRNQVVGTQVQTDADACDYRLVRLLGRGGMGNVFVARQGSLDRLIAVKVIRPLDESKRQRLAKDGKLEQVEQTRRQQFLSEAVVTGDLDHPNIVPIHDVAITGDSTLFYSMKRVVGTPWSDVIAQKTRDENLEILIKVADAIGFAHTRGVVHRDIKPENVMLGDFGVVMVMDWGIALAKPEFEKLDSITPATGLGGTPSMMAPEMATGPIERIGPAADIYLLGATLFMIITGKPPHHAANVSQCLRAVATNEIRPFDAKHQGELMNIALQAMATRSGDRFADVTAFQEAIRNYRSHAESIALTTRAREDLEIAEAENTYPRYTRAQFGFEEAIALWAGNESAQNGLRQTKLAHAEAAYRNEDFDLGLSLLDENDAEHVDLIARLKDALRSRRQREARFALLKKAAAAMFVFILIGGTVAFVINQEARSRAEQQREIAEQQTLIAQREEQNAKRQEEIAREQALIAREQTTLAEQNAREAKANEMLARGAEADAKTQRDRADENSRLAEASANDARRSADVAEIAKAKAEYEAYVSTVGLAKARIDRNEFTEARRLIDGLIDARPPDAIPWELRYLASLANQASASVATVGVPTNLAVAEEPNATPVLVRMEDGSAVALSIRTGQSPSISVVPGETATQRLANMLSREHLTSCAIRNDGGLAAAGTPSGEIVLFDPRNLGADNERDAGPLQRLSGHRDRVTSLQWIHNRYLVSGSVDRTVRVWDLNSTGASGTDASGVRSETLWHIAPVVDVAVAETGKDFRIAAAVAEKGLAQVVIWNVASAGPPKAERVGVFEQHETPVSRVAISPDADLIASGDNAGNVFLWRVDRLRQRDVASLVKKAVQSSAESKPRNRITPTNADEPLFTRLEGVHLDDQTDAAFAEKPLPAPESDETRTLAHRGTVRGLCFSSDGQALLSCGDDYLTRQWTIDANADSESDTEQRPTGRLTRTLRGHGGAVTDAVFLDNADPAEDDVRHVLTVGADQAVRLWISSDAVSLSMPTVDRGDAGEQSDRVVPISPESNRVHEDEIEAASFSNDGTKIVTASRDRTAKILSIDQATLQIDSRLELSNEDLKPSSDVSLESGDRARKSWSEITNLSEGTSYRAMSMAVRRPTDRLFVGGADSVIRIWNLTRGTEVGTLSGTGLNQVFAVSNDSRTILTGSGSPESRSMLWRLDPRTNRAEVLHRLGGHEEAIASVAISADTTRASTADRAGRIMLWDVNTGNAIGRPMDNLLGTRVNDVVFTPDGNSIWVAADDSRLSRIDLASRSIVDRVDHEGFVTSVQLSSDGRRAVTTSELQKIDATVHRATWWQLPETNEDNGQQSGVSEKTLVELTTKSDSRTRSGGRPGIASVAIDPNGTQVLIAVNPPGNAASRIERWRADDAIASAKKEWVLGLPSMLGDVSATESVRDDELITLHGNAAFRWNSESQDLLVSYRISGALSVAAFSPDGNIVATGSRSLKLWDASSGKALRKLESPHEGLIRAIVFGKSAERTTLFTGGDDGVIRQWAIDGESSEIDLLASRKLDDAAVSDRVLSLSLSPEGRWLLSTTSGGRVVLFDLETDSQRLIFSDAGVGEINASCFSPDGRFVAVGGQDRLARLWDLSKPPGDGTAPDAVFRGHAEAIESIAMTGERSETDPSLSTLRLFSAARDRSVRVWDGGSPVTSNETSSPRSGRELLELVRHRGGVTAVQLNAAGTLMMTAGRDGNVILWPAR